MEQLSMFCESIPYPNTFDDIDHLYKEYIFEGEKDEDAFTVKDRKDGKSKSYYFYGKRLFTFQPDFGKGSKLKKVIKIPVETEKDGEIIVDEKIKEVLITPDELFSFLNELKETKHIIFRNLITESFACCNDFKRCSREGACLYPDDRFYNGCYYRTNLESGINFWKESDHENSSI